MLLDDLNRADSGTFDKLEINIRWKLKGLNYDWNELKQLACNLTTTERNELSANWWLKIKHWQIEKE